MSIGKILNNESLYKIQNTKLIIYNTFNDELDNLFIGFTSKSQQSIITHIEFSDVEGTEVFSLFNQSVITLPKNIKIIEFGSIFNGQFISNKYMYNIQFGDFFNQPLETSKNLKNVHFGLWFNQIILIPKHMTKITFGYSYNQPIILNKCIKILSLGKHYSCPVHFTESLNYLSINTPDENILDSVPNNIKIIGLCHQNIDLNWNVPNSINKIIIMMPRYLHENMCTCTNIGTSTHLCNCTSTKLLSKCLSMYKSYIKMCYY